MTGCDCGASAGEAHDPKLRQILWLALVANAVMFAIDMVASLVGESVALQADALDFMGDSLTYAITLSVLGLSLRARSRAALIKSVLMASFAAWVIGSAVYRTVAHTVPDAVVMSVTGALALLVNVTVAIRLFRYRDGDSNRRSIWLCSRNDAIGNVAVLLAASGVFVTSTGWPDIVVAIVIAGLNFTAAYHVFWQAREEIRHEQASAIP